MSLIRENVQAVRSGHPWTVVLGYTDGYTSRSPLYPSSAA